MREQASEKCPNHSLSFIIVLREVRIQRFTRFPRYKLLFTLYNCKVCIYRCATKCTPSSSFNEVVLPSLQKGEKNNKGLLSEVH